MVRLKGRKPRAPFCSYDSFQFQNGAIKRPQFCTVNTKSENFQFQNGAIKSLNGKIRRPMIAFFQFQNGAIKS